MSRVEKQTVLIATGASGGHIFPSLAVAKALEEQGVHSHFVIGGPKFSYLVKQAGFEHTALPAAPFNVRNPVRKVRALLVLLWAFIRGIALVYQVHPSAIFTTGGYAAVAPVLAAKILGVPVVILEQNALPGRANRLLARWADNVLLTFAAARKHLKGVKAPVEVVGNPARQEILQAVDHHRQEDGRFRLLVLGGSQGARVLSEVLPDMLEHLALEDRRRLEVVHQARPEDVEWVKNRYEPLNLMSFRVTPFLEDVAVQLVNAHLVIARAGAGTLTEICLIGRAAVYVPLPLADHHQLYNAQAAEEAGAAVILEQNVFTPDMLLPHVENIMHNHERLKAMEEAAKTVVPTDATARVAQALLAVVQHDVMTMPTPVEDA